MRTVVGLLLLALAAPLALAQSTASIASEVSILTSSCLDMLDQVYDSYRLAVEPYTADGCNTTCLENCLTVVQDGINAVYSKDCPPQDELVYCFNRFPATWAQYATLCGLFSLSDPSAEAASEGGTVGAPYVYNASREVAWSAPDALETNLRRLMSLESEAEAGTTSAGCFPSFQDIDSFRLWMNGTYWTDVYDPPSNAGGITVSVFFWIGLTALGFGTRKG